MLICVLPARAIAGTKASSNSLAGVVIRFHHPLILTPYHSPLTTQHPLLHSPYITHHSTLVIHKTKKTQTHHLTLTTQQSPYTNQHAPLHSPCTTHHSPLAPIPHPSPLPFGLSFFSMKPWPSLTTTPHPQTYSSFLLLPGHFHMERLRGPA